MIYLLYVCYVFISRIDKYWNINPKFDVHSAITNCMGQLRFEQIQRYVKIFNPLTIGIAIFVSIFLIGLRVLASKMQYRRIRSWPRQPVKWLWKA